ncbi:Protein CBG02127 [Caenorhabditis briggsae]|nr:Protein CBG02127 [Caenorhabditis briggsae]ULT80717.1 hypothetical protein L3Y34_010934 [Caenorhabditis briggsae]CAP23271.2 Protein CBG02127 [Caenorhabditis briggsae]
MSLVSDGTRTTLSSDFTDSSRTNSPIDVGEAMDLSSGSSSSSSQGSGSSPSFSQKTHPGKETVAMSIAQPRLTVNGKRVGRPPGTFKVHKILKKSLVEEVHQNTEKVCKWKDCYQTFHSVEEITFHINQKHFDKEIVCRWEGCDPRYFKSLYLLVGHCRSHTGERHLKCPIEDCPKAYKSRENLSTHVRTHTGEKPYFCQFENCTKRFTNASDRGKHENRCHSGRREYKCDVPNCTKSYTDPSSLRKHILHIHGPEVHESRKKKKVRWMYRRDGKQLNKDGSVTTIDSPAIASPKENGSEARQAPIDTVQMPLQSVFPQLSPIQQNSPIQQLLPPTPTIGTAIPEWNPSPRVQSDFPFSAFNSYVPNYIQMNVAMASLLTVDQKLFVASKIIERQQFVHASHETLQKPTPVLVKTEYKQCECNDCKKGTFVRAYPSLRE